MHSAPFYSQHPRLCELSVPVKMADRPGNSACPLSTQIILFFPPVLPSLVTVFHLFCKVRVFHCGTGQNWSFNRCFSRSKEAALGSLSHVKDFACHCQFLKLGFSLPVSFWTTCLSVSLTRSFQCHCYRCDPRY